MRPFRVDVPESDLDDLRERLARTRWPEPATVEGWSQGVPLDYARELAEYWADRYDWRRLETEINRFPQFTTLLDGGGDDSLTIHLIHARSPHPEARPLLLTHGWPGSVVEFLDIIDELTDPPDPRDAFHVVAPSLPGYGFSEKPSVCGWGVERIATAWAQLMDLLDYEEFFAAGGDWGSMITTALAVGMPEMVKGIHITLPTAPRPEGEEMPALSAEEKAGLRRYKEFRATGSGYSAIQGTRPQTIGYGLVDSPSALLTWIVEKFWDWTDCIGFPDNAITRDRILDNVTLYWLTATGASSARLYWESRRLSLDEVTVPTGVTMFPQELRQPPRAWVERRYTDLRHWTRQSSGGHFASLEEPETYVDELRTFFGALR